MAWGMCESQKRAVVIRIYDSCFGGKATAPVMRKLPVSARELPKLKMEVNFCGEEWEKWKNEMMKKERSVSFMAEMEMSRGRRELRYIISQLQQLPLPNDKEATCFFQSNHLWKSTICKKAA
ncbi:hypothetical protein M5K25_003467 [Dendrobium thyrsiflorum]|uniref:Uncharacterized protein n=1 Tax=Dendrobium thyrsiflorum TaxID=117978 RepID=A0ABD0VKC2_DENTH